MYASERSQLQNSFNWIENYNIYNPITKEGRIVGSPFYLMLGSSFNGGEWFLFSIDEPNQKLDLRIFLFSLEAHWSGMKP